MRKIGRFPINDAATRTVRTGVGIGALHFYS